MSHHATQTSLPLPNNARELHQLQEENQLLQGKIRGYLTLGFIIYSYCHKNNVKLSTCIKWIVIFTEKKFEALLC
jgi:hypothetical protein